MSAGELFPELQVFDMPWRIQELKGTRMARSGNSQTVEMVEPFWVIDTATTWLTKEQFQLWDAFITAREGSAVTFTAYRMSRTHPQAGGVASDAGLGISAWNRANRTLSFSGTGAWTATKGDMLSYYTKLGGYWCGMAMETKAAVAGAMSNLKVYPPPFEPHADTPAPRRIRALAEFFMDMPIPKPIERNDERRVSFTATQMIRG